jgi:C1A family cysteine protease
MDITTNVSNLYDGNSTVYASIDNQQMQLNAKVIPTILIENYTTSLNNINLTITANKDISGNFNLTINNYTSKLTAKQKTRLYYPISDLNPGEYVINLTYSGNSKYDKTSVYSYLTIQSNEYIQNETITPTLTKAIVNSTSIPSKYSLLDLGLLTPVKSQGSAGSCVSFAAVGVMESALKKLTNITYDLSENNVKTCLRNTPSMV